MDLIDKTDAVPSAAHLPHETLAALHEELWEPLARSATWLVGNRQVGEELAQDAFVRLIEHWPKIADKKAVPSWLYRTVVNLSRSSNRRNAIGREKRALARTHAAVIDRSSESFGSALVDEALGGAVLRLPRRQRECLVLRFVHDMPVDQVAATLQISSGSVKTHLHRALSKLQAFEGTDADEQ